MVKRISILVFLACFFCSSPALAVGHHKKAPILTIERARIALVRYIQQDKPISYSLGQCTRWTSQRFDCAYQESAASATIGIVISDEPKAPETLEVYAIIQEIHGAICVRTRALERDIPYCEKL